MNDESSLFQLEMWYAITENCTAYLDDDHSPPNLED